MDALLLFWQHIPVYDKTECKSWYAVFKHILFANGTGKNLLSVYSNTLFLSQQQSCWYASCVLSSSAKWPSPFDNLAVYDFSSLTHCQSTLPDQLSIRLHSKSTPGDNTLTQQSDMTYRVTIDMPRINTPAEINTLFANLQMCEPKQIDCICIQLDPLSLTHKLAYALTVWDTDVELSNCVADPNRAFLSHLNSIVVKNDPWTPMALNGNCYVREGPNNRPLRSLYSCTVSVDFWRLFTHWMHVAKDETLSSDFVRMSEQCVVRLYTDASAQFEYTVGKNKVQCTLQHVTKIDLIR